jgi:hypothetical protein
VKNPSSIQIGITARKALQPMNLDVAVEVTLEQPRRLEPALRFFTSFRMTHIVFKMPYDLWNNRV